MNGRADRQMDILNLNETELSRDIENKIYGRLLISQDSAFTNEQLIYFLIGNICQKLIIYQLKLVWPKSM